jgi:IMP dehydrogenase
MVPGYSEIATRFDVDLVTPDKIGTNIPIVVANMNAIAGKRMAETVARRGGITVLPQDIPLDVIEQSVNYVKNAHIIYDTPITLRPDDNIAKALDLIHKRSHKAVITIDHNHKPIGIFCETDAVGLDRFTKLSKIMSSNVFTLKEGISSTEAYNLLDKNRLFMAPIVNDQGVLIGALTKNGALRGELYKPSLSNDGKLLVAGAIGINGNPASRAEHLVNMGINTIVLDTAHGHQRKMIEAIKSTRIAVGGKINIVAGNVATAEATKDLINAGANIVKVGIGPGAMCTTRMMTGVGRPQFSAVLECSKQAKQLNAHVWADGGVRHPRDIALALGAGASNVMFGSWFGGTYESAADILQDTDGRLYKENYGMASRRAVKGRNEQQDVYSKAKKELFEEGISASRLYLNPQRPGVEDIIDHIVAGLRSSMAYAGASNISEFQQKAVFGVQMSSGYNEGLPLLNSWQ